MDVASGDNAEALLVRLGRAYGIQATRDNLQQALADAEHGAALAEWATVHLGSENLLTPDELAL